MPAAAIATPVAAGASTGSEGSVCTVARRVDRHRHDPRYRFRRFPGPAHQRSAGHCFDLRREGADLCESHGLVSDSFLQDKTMIAFEMKDIGCGMRLPGRPKGPSTAVRSTELA